MGTTKIISFHITRLIRGKHVATATNTEELNNHNTVAIFNKMKAQTHTESGIYRYTYIYKVHIGTYIHRYICTTSNTDQILPNLKSFSSASTPTNQLFLSLKIM